MKLKDLYSLSDRDLIAEVTLFTDGLTPAPAVYGLAAPDVTGTVTATSDFEVGVDTLDTKRTEAAAARGDRDTLRRTLIERVRDQMKKARLTVGNDAGLLGAVNMSEYDTTPSTPDAPASVPFALIDYGILRHIIKFRDTAAPDKRGKPKGVLGCEIWSKIGGDPAATESDYSMVALDTSSPQIITYSMADAGKTVWYRMRWVTTNGDKGGWSETVEATING